MFGTDSRDDGQTEHAAAGHVELRQGNVLDQVAVEPSLKTEAPGHAVWVRPWGPRPGLERPEHRDHSRRGEALRQLQGLGLRAGPHGTSWTAVQAEDTAGPQ